MPGHDIIVIGASAGGVEALIEVVRAVPPDLPAAVFVVLHIPPDGASALPQILTAPGLCPPHTRATAIRSSRPHLRRPAGSSPARRARAICA